MLQCIQEARRDGVGIGSYDLKLTDRTISVHKELDNNLTFTLQVNAFKVSLHFTMKNPWRRCAFIFQ
ncbi:MAG: hypothetical protein ABSG70_11305 [Terriglobales bacterium]